MRRLLLSAIFLVTFGCATTPTGPTENTTDCKTYLETEHDDRIGQWVNTFRRGLESNPSLGRLYHNCLLTVPRVESADIGLGRDCQVNPDLDFDAAVEKHLEAQFQMCGLTFEPVQE